MENMKVENKQDIEKLLSNALRDVALEIRSIDAIDLVSYIHTAKLANIGDLVHSALELYFKPGTMMFSYTGDAKLNWFGKPKISLDMEFHGDGFDVFFRLITEALASYVEVEHISQGGSNEMIVADSLKLEQALKSARLYHPAHYEYCNSRS